MITLLLCVLAFSFAMEAKMAWYGPAEGPGSDVRAAKAMPADSPELVFDGVPTPDPLHPQLPVLILAGLTAVLVLAIVAVEERGTVRAHAQAPGTPSFYPGIFFRPPPVR